MPPKSARPAAELGRRGEWRKRYRDQIIRKQDQYRKLWVSVLRRGVEQGVFRIEDPKLAFFGIIGALNYVENWFNPSGLLSREQVAEVFSRWILRSLEV
jgi:hypothetical protein